MHIEVITVTPKMASKWLQKNTINRPLQRGIVENLKSSFSRGEYVLSHQGIAFDETGTLVDGQHRLTAIAELQGFAFPMFVATGLSQDSFKVMDIGRKRSASDCLREDRRLVETANTFASICEKSRTKSVTPTKLIPFIERIRDHHFELTSYCGTVSKTWSSVNIRSAAILSMMTGGDKDYVKAVYRALVLMDIDAMPPCAKVLFKAQLSGALNISDRADTIARALVVFDKKRANNKQIKVYDTQNVYLLVRDLFADIA